MATVPTTTRPPGAAQDIAAAVRTLRRDPRFATIAEPLSDLLIMAAPYAAGPVEPPAQTWTGKAIAVARAVLAENGGAAGPPPTPDPDQGARA